MDVAERYARAFRVDPTWLLRGDAGITRDLTEAARQVNALREKPHPFVTALEEVVREIEAGKIPRVNPMVKAIEAVAREVAEIRPRSYLRAEVEAVLDQSPSMARAVPANDLEEAGALAVVATGEGDDVPGARRIDIVEYEAAAGGGAEATEEQVVGTLTFRRNWLDRHGLDATQCTVIAVRGESMEPTLWEGASILVNRGQTEWRRGRIFVFRTSDGLVVKRAGEDEAGERVLVSDNPAHRMTPCPDDAEIIGQVAWTARTLIGDDMRLSRRTRLISSNGEHQ